MEFVVLYVFDVMCVVIWFVQVSPCRLARVLFELFHLTIINQSENNNRKSPEP